MRSSKTHRSRQQWAEEARDNMLVWKKKASDSVGMGTNIGLTIGGAAPLAS